MPRSVKSFRTKSDTAAKIGYEAQLWQMADALRGGMDAAEPFVDKMKRLVKQLREQQTEAAKFDAAIAANLKELGYGK